MHAKGSNIGSCFATDPKHSQLAIIVEFVELAFMNSADTKLAFNGGNEWRTLEQGSRQSLECASELWLPARQLVVKANNADVFLSCALLRFYESSCTVDTDNQTSCNFGVECATVAGFLYSVDMVS